MIPHSLSFGLSYEATQTLKHARQPL